MCMSALFEVEICAEELDRLRGSRTSCVSCAFVVFVLVVAGTAGVATGAAVSTHHSLFFLPSALLGSADVGASSPQLQSVVLLLSALIMAVFQSFAPFPHGSVEAENSVFHALFAGGRVCGGDVPQFYVLEEATAADGAPEPGAFQPADASAVEPHPSADPFHPLSCAQLFAPVPKVVDSGDGALS